MIERTLLMIKPDAVQRNLIGKITDRLETAGFKVVELKMVHLKPAVAREFYKVHEGRPFLDELGRVYVVFADCCDGARTRKRRCRLA